MKDIKIYTTTWCSYCKLAKRFFQEKGWDYEEIDISNMSEEELMNIGKGIYSRPRMIGVRMTIPQIIIDGEPIGGYDDLIRIYKQQI
jgi:glutaredoxin|tara:strand:+ start:55 stop:315 length:261 start_codon:yes stop_codon:yes gene_type:complete